MDHAENQEGPASGPSPEASTEGTANVSSAPLEDRKVVMGVLAYLGILVIVPYLTSLQDPFIKFHVKQGLVLLIMEVIAAILYWVMPFFFFIAFVLHLTAFVLSVLGIVNVLQRKEQEVPLVGHYASHIAI